MKTLQIIIQITTLSLLCSFSLFLLNGCTSIFQKENKAKESEIYSVAAYVWPSCHNEEQSREMLWQEGIGEWEIIKKGTPRFEGHYQPRTPLWGYTMDDDPVVWEKKIDAATDHGVNVFIFDWYWYNGKPFLEESVNNGFLQARNNDKMKFYIMWANHDVPGNMWNHYRYKSDSLIWHGEVEWNDFKALVDRIINQYFIQPNYFKIDNEPVLSIYSLSKLVQSFDGIVGAREALDYFREKVKKAGFPGLHIQLVGKYNGGNHPYFGDVKAEVNDVVSILDANSVTMYNMAGLNSRKEDYLKYGEAGIMLRKKWDSTLKIPFFPCVSAGWDNTPRYPNLGKEAIIHRHNTPESFGAYLQKAKDYARSHPEQPKLIIINAWNEWVEGSYLEPDMLWGYGYLEAVKKVMSGRYDKYYYSNN
jgi:hypothetical protein